MAITLPRVLAVVCALLLMLFSALGCGSEPTPTLAPTHTSAAPQAPTATVARSDATSPPPATQTEVAPSGETEVTATVEPTGMSSGLSSATPSPSATRTRRPTMTAAPASPTPPPATGPIGGPDFPPDVNPLTGLTVAEPAVLERCPLAIKVSNAPAVVRPQAGLDKADLVFEHYAEGGVTRLTAVFLGETPTMVGSVRSGRLIDLEIPAMFKALFAYSGTSAGVGQKYASSDLWPDQLARPGTASGAFYRRDLPKAFEHTLFINPTTLWEEAERRGISGRQDLRGLTFSPEPPAGGTQASEIGILYRSGISQVEWIYEASDDVYYRWQGGAAHREELTGTQLSAANVIVVAANHVETDIVEDTWGGGHWSIEIQVWGRGPVSVFRNGQRYDGVWRRQDRHDMLSFWSEDGGQRMPLNPGNSWVQLVPLGFTGLEVSP